MYRIALALLATFGFAIGTTAHAQPAARVTVTVTPAATAGVTPAADGFSVCIGTSLNRTLYGTQTTTTTGEVTFDNLPVDEDVRVTVSKTGFTGRDVSHTTQPGGNNNVALAPAAGSGGPACGTVVNANPFALVVFARNASGTAIPDAQICVGTSADLDQYAAVKSGGSVGRATFNLPVAAAYSITTSKLGYVGRTASLSGSGTSGSVTMALAGGSGGPICPGAAIQADATTSVSLPPAQLPELSVTLKQSTNPIVAGTQQRYTVKVYNKGVGVASNVLLRSALPADLTFLSVTVEKSFVCTRSGTTLNCPSGIIPVSDSATITVVMKLPGTASSGHDILFGTKVDADNTIPESNETNNNAAAVSITQAAPRLGEEPLGNHGIMSTVYLAEGGVSLLDCKDFGASFVMVGIEGIGQPDLINHLRVVCAPMLSTGLGTAVSRTSFFFKTNKEQTFPRTCPSGFAVKGMQGSLRNGRLVSLTVHCQQVVATGLLANSSVILAPTSMPGPTPFGVDACTLSRPGRALRVGATANDGLLSPLMVVGIQMICEQPVVP